jgi:glycosyltransferase involved in cell wall biosynthesis
MSPHKGVARAAKVARKAGARLLIAAKMREPAEHAYFESAVAPLLGDGIEYIGEVGGPEKMRILAKAACLLNPLAWPEPFGMVMIEAMAYGTPVVATPCGSVPELIEDGVTGFIRSNDEELADALERCAQLDRSKCHQIAAERFSTERMVRDHLMVYERILASHNSAAKWNIEAVAAPTFDADDMTPHAVAHGRLNDVGRHGSGSAGLELRRSR